MDPNAALAEIRKLVERASDLESFPRPDPAELLTELAEAVEGLDEWLSKGGFLPTAWEKNRTVIWELNRKQVTDLVKNVIGRHQIRVAVDGGQFKYDGGTGWVAGIKPTKTVEQG